MLANLHHCTSCAALAGAIDPQLSSQLVFSLVRTFACAAIARRAVHIAVAVNIMLELAAERTRCNNNNFKFAVTGVDAVLLAGFLQQLVARAQ
jgi:hypothetical protein